MARPKLKECPVGGTGVHAFLYYAACRCLDAGMSIDDAEAYIAPLMSRPPAPPDEVRDALESASGERSTPPRWPGRDFKLIQEIFRRPLTPWKPLPITAEEAVDILFPGNPYLCVGKSSSIFATRRREAWRGKLGANSLIVPSPMTGPQGRTKAGHLSAHTLESTGPRHYLVTEWDWGLRDNHLRMIQHLRQFGALAAVVHSGGRSMQAWWDAKGESDDAMKNFFSYAATLGADTHLWLRSQFCRLPMGLRDGQTPQQVFYLRTQ